MTRSSDGRGWLQDDDPLLHVRPDEEPDVTTVNYSHTSLAKGTCGFCGQYGHRIRNCPNDPSRW